MRIFSWFQDRLQHAAQDNSHLDLTPQTRDSLCKALKAENVETVRVCPNFNLKVLRDHRHPD